MLKKAAHSHAGEAGTNECLSLLLEKWTMIDSQQRWQTHAVACDCVTITASPCFKWNNSTGKCSLALAGTKYSSDWVSLGLTWPFHRLPLWQVSLSIYLPLRHVCNVFSWLYVFVYHCCVLLCCHYKTTFWVWQSHAQTWQLHIISVGLPLEIIQS